MARKKQKRNISGPRNQPKVAANSSFKERHDDQPLTSNRPEASQEASQDGLEGQAVHAEPEVEKEASDYERESVMGNEPCDDVVPIPSKVEDGAEDEVLEQRALTRQVVVKEKGGHDEEWLPARKKQRKEIGTGRPSSYIKGPDVASKSERTRSRYRDSIQAQNKLDGFGFFASSSSTGVNATSPVEIG